MKKLYRGRYLKNLSTEQVFTNIYKSGGWIDSESKSGPGSRLEVTEAIREELPKLVADLSIKTFLDLPCGDFNWMQHVDLGIDQYIGADIVQMVIDDNNQKYANEKRKFVTLDLLRDSLPQADILLCRDCLSHLNYEDINKALTNLQRSEITYFLTTTYYNIENNLNIVTGQWRPLNFLLPPFNFSEPVRIIAEKSPSGSSKRRGKSLGLWRVSDLKCAMT